MKGLFRKLLLGDTKITEYSTVTVAGEIKERVFLESGGSAIDISTIHWLLCLEPIVFGVWITNDVSIPVPNEKIECRMYFSDSPADNFVTAKKNTVAVIALNYFDKIDDGGGTLYFLKLKKSRIYHINSIKTFLLFFKYYKKPKLSFEKYKSLVAAYSYPRRVRIISFKDEEYFNIFPMDLLGEIPGVGRHVFGLRHTNVTLAKIIETKKMVVCEVPYVYKDTIYELGKHHGGNPPSRNLLPFKLKETKNFGFFIPEWANSYKEIQIITIKNLGSHMMLWGKIVNEEALSQSAGNLFHIHFLLYYHQKMRKMDYQTV